MSYIELMTPSYFRTVEKATAFTFLIIYLIFSSYSGETKVDFLERTLVKTFKLRNFNEFKKIITTPENMEGNLSSNPASFNSQSENKDLVEHYRRCYLNYYENLFNNLIKAGESLGIVWKNIELVSFLYKINTPISGSELHLLNGHINFRSENKNYFLYGIDAQEYKSGYKVSFIRNIKQGVLTKYINSNNFPEPEF